MTLTPNTEKKECAARPDTKKKVCTARPDTGWSWMVVFAACMNNFIMAGLARLAAVLYVSCIEAYGATRADAARPFSIAVSARNLIGPIVGALGQHFGVRKITIIGGIVAAVGVGLCSLAKDIFWVTICWGGIFGLGFGLGNILPQVAINQYFVRYRTTAAGIAFSGGCFGSFILPILVDFFIDYYSLSGTFLILGGIVMHVIPSGMIMRKPPWLVKEDKKTKTKKSIQNSTSQVYHDASTLPTKTEVYIINKTSVPSYGSKDFSKDVHQSIKELEAMKCDLPPIEKKEDKEVHIFLKTLDVLVNPLFLLIGITLGLFVYIFVSVITIVIDFAIDEGVPEIQGKYIIPAFAMGDLVGRLCLGWITDRKFLSIKNFTVIIYLCLGIVMVLFTFAGGFQMLMIVAAFYGLFEGAVVVLYPGMVANYLPSNQQSIAMGSMNLFAGVFAFGVAPMIGYFRDKLGSYNYIFYLLGVLSALNSLLWLMEPLFLKLRPKAVITSTDATQEC